MFFYEFLILTTALSGCSWGDEDCHVSEDLEGSEWMVGYLLWSLLLRMGRLKNEKTMNLSISSWSQTPSFLPSERSFSVFDDSFLSGYSYSFNSWIIYIYDSFKYSIFLSFIAFKFWLPLQHCLKSMEKFVSCFLLLNNFFLSWIFLNMVRNATFS